MSYLASLVPYLSIAAHLLFLTITVVHDLLLLERPLLDWEVARESMKSSFAS